MMTFRNFAPAVVFMLFAGGGASAQENAGRIEALAREARSAGEHADVAKRYRVHAESLETAAAEFESRVAQLASASASISAKWPSMAPRTLTQTRQQAAEARRAAQECRQLAERHQGFAVEALATQ